MIGEKIYHYSILEKLGEGGMGVVYLAEDTKLQRKVALKFLPPELTSDEEAKQRFVREAQAASALQHNNICTIHEINETDDGRLFICMDHYRGETLRERVSRGPLPIEEALDVIIQAASGLSKAHRAGIVHRDLKPANILITDDGVVKILDFGLAKLTERTKITKTDRSPGTPSYMSPEQARSEKVDGRSDIFSLGVVLYEMLTAIQPFKGDYEASILYGIVHDTPVLPSSHRPEVPPELDQVVSKALEKSPDKRYQHADELLNDLKIIREAVSKGSKIRVRLIANRPITQRLKVSIIAISAVTVLVVVAAILLFFPMKSVPFSKRDFILITDMENLTGEQIFDRSLNTALIISIQQSQYVNVYPRSRIKDTLKRMGKAGADTLDEALASEIAQREGIRALLVPTISSFEDTYLITARIVDPQSLVDLKTEMVRADGKDEILNALGDLAKKIRRDLGESLPSIAKRNAWLPHATTPSLEALKKFSDGSNAWHKTMYKEAVALYHEAVKLDSCFAWAHTTLGMYYYWIRDRQKGDLHFEAALRNLDNTTERERLWILSLIASSKSNHEDAIKYMKLHSAKYPDDRDSWYNLGNELMKMRLPEDAITAYDKALEIDPHMPAAYINKATCYQLTQQHQNAIENYEKAFAEEPGWITQDNINREYGFAYVALGELDKAREIFQMMLTQPGVKKAMGYRSLALLEMYLGRYKSAVEPLQKSILEFRSIKWPASEARNHLFLARAYSKMEKMDLFLDEMNHFSKIAESTYITPWYMMFGGKLYARAGMQENADSILQDIESEMSATNAEDQMGFNLLKGEIELLKGNYDDAIELFETVCLTRRDNFNLESLAYAYVKRGDTDRALTTYEELIGVAILGWEGQECWLQAHFQAGKLYEERGDIESAIQYYKKLLDIWKDAEENVPLLRETKGRLAKLKTEN
jgi:serine/threonine protein kinase/tetratricopeptide (TPR) repeat protein